MIVRGLGQGTGCARGQRMMLFSRHVGQGKLLSASR